MDDTFGEVLRCVDLMQNADIGGLMVSEVLIFWRVMVFVYWLWGFARGVINCGSCTRVVF